MIIITAHHIFDVCVFLKSPLIAIPETGKDFELELSQLKLKARKSGVADPIWD